MVGLLTVVGVGTGLIYFVGGSFYGALIFHNFMALFGIVSSLADAGQLGTYQQPLVPLLVTALVTLPSSSEWNACSSVDPYLQRSGRSSRITARTVGLRFERTTVRWPGCITDQFL